MSVGLGIKRWIFTDPATAETAAVQTNPNQMDTPTTPRAMQWGFSADGKLRGIDNGSGTPPPWSFGGVILSKAHYDRLLLWSMKDKVLRVTDHLERTFEIIIEQYDPIERLPTKTKPWRADFTMTCLLLKEIT